MAHCNTGLCALTVCGCWCAGCRDSTHVVGHGRGLVTAAPPATEIEVLRQRIRDLEAQLADATPPPIIVQWLAGRAVNEAALHAALPAWLVEALQVARDVNAADLEDRLCVDEEGRCC